MKLCLCQVSVLSGRPVEWYTEENYMFKLTHFRNQLLDWLRTSPSRKFMPLSSPSLPFSFYCWYLLPYSCGASVLQEQGAGMAEEQGFDWSVHLSSQQSTVLGYSCSRGSFSNCMYAQSQTKCFFLVLDLSFKLKYKWSMWFGLKKSNTFWQFIVKNQVSSQNASHSFAMWSQILQLSKQLPHYRQQN